MDAKMPRKKNYVAPALQVHGDVEKITMQFGSSYVDVPTGTPTGGVGGVTGSTP